MDFQVESQRGLIQRIIDQCGPRLAGSKKEKQAAGMIAEEFMSVAGNVFVEEFTFASRAGIGSIPALGIGLMIAGFFFFWQPLVSLLLVCAILFFAVSQVFLYREWFDDFFPVSTSRNVYSIIDPPGGKANAKGLLVISGHIDSSWHSPLFAQSGGYTRLKLKLGVLSALTLLVLSLLRFLDAENQGVLPVSLWWLMLLVPFLYIGFYFLFRFIVYDSRSASPGAMDNLSGLAVALNMVKTIRDDKKKAPKNMRILLAGFGAEEAGLRGSRAFVRRHRKDLLAGDVWVLNIDGVADIEHFHCLEGERWQMVRYDRGYVDMVAGIMDEMGLKYRRWMLDAGGTDSAEFVKAGIRKAITVAAQDPTPLQNYHTSMDTLEHMDPAAMSAMNELCLRIVQKIDSLAGESAGNPVQ